MFSSPDHKKVTAEESINEADKMPDDGKMTAEESINEAHKIFEYIASSLEKILSADVNSGPSNASGFYNSGTAKNLSVKREHMQVDLELSKEGAKGSLELREELLATNLVLPEKYSP